MSLFKAYDLRGEVPAELDDTIAYRIGRAYSEHYSPKKVALGYDIREESPGISSALCKGLVEGGTDVIDIGLCGTEEVYFATFNSGLDGGIMVTASHNPKGHNGMKLVGPQARPISSETGLLDIKHLIETRDYSAPADHIGKIIHDKSKDSFIEHLLGYIDLKALRPLKIVANPGNGGAGLIVKELEKYLPCSISYINEEPDGSFPNGVPNPLLKPNQLATSLAVVAQGADLGLAWDGDFDRCFFFDHEGQFIEGYYLVGLLAESLLRTHPNEKIVHDPRLTWNTIEQTQVAGGTPILSKCGHAFIKQTMREQDALYGGEMSAHHYFRDFSYCDSGMIPWLLIAELISVKDLPLKNMVAAQMQAFPCSGEINFKVNDTQTAMNTIREAYADEALSIDELDGISMIFEHWRFNLRSSNTEPLLRLNVESKASEQLVTEQVEKISGLIQA